MSCIHKDSWQSRLYYKNVCGLNFHPPYSIRNASTHVCCCFCFLTCGCLSPCSFTRSHWVESPFWDDRQIWPRLTIKNHKISTDVHWVIAQINLNKKVFVQLWRFKLWSLHDAFHQVLFQVIGVSSFDVNISSRPTFLDSDHQVIYGFSLKFIYQMNFLSKWPALANFLHCSINIYILNFNLIYPIFLYNNQINARALIGQSAMVYCASKLMEKSRVFWIIILKAIDHKFLWFIGW